MIAQDLWQAHYQILSITFLKEFIELNVNTNMMIKNVRLAGLNISIATVFLNIQVLKVISKNINVCVVIKIINTSLTKS